MPGAPFVISRSAVQFRAPAPREIKDLWVGKVPLSGGPVSPGLQEGFKVGLTAPNDTGQIDALISQRRRTLIGLRAAFRSFSQ